VYHHPYRLTTQFYQSTKQRCRALFSDVDDNMVDELLGGWSTLLTVDSSNPEEYSLPKISFLSPTGENHNSMLDAVKVIFDSSSNAKNATVLNAIVRNNDSWETNMNRGLRNERKGWQLYPLGFEGIDRGVSPFGLIEVSEEREALLINRRFAPRHRSASIFYR